MAKLAINGGKPIREKPFPKQITVGKEEEQAALRVIRKGQLSRYRGTWSNEFWGGEEVQAFEKEWAQKFNVKYTIAVNSCTSALITVCGAIGLSPGEEVIVTPWSMTCSASAPLIWNAVPVFADIEKDYFCLDPESIERVITDKTRAIIVVSLFGQPYDVEKIKAIARKYNLYIIEDAAQAPGAQYKNEFTGNLGDLGCFSFTSGKHMTCGEGGMITTNDSKLAMRCRLIRNHAEAVINEISNNNKELQTLSYLNNMIGFNFRMTELNAAIMREQLKKLNNYIDKRYDLVQIFNKELKDFPGIEIIHPRPHCIHSYYVQPFKWNSEKAEGIHRDIFINALKAELPGEKGRENEGVIGCGYIKPIYRMPLFVSKMLYGGTYYPFMLSNQAQESLNSIIGRCPNVEKLWKDELWLWRLTSLPLTTKDIQDVIDAFEKVWGNKEKLK